uniref:Uncharacterized protein n=1 Tax=Anopheles christyi TaxID=43041 RepID=A0A182KI51_9DIPT
MTDIDNSLSISLSFASTSAVTSQIVGAFEAMQLLLVSKFDSIRHVSSSMWGSWVDETVMPLSAGRCST